MMNYQYPQSYIENPELIKMSTPPPMLPALDPNEVEQTLRTQQLPYYAVTGSVPVANNNTPLANTGTVLFSKTPRVDSRIQSRLNVQRSKPLPHTPPPPNHIIHHSNHTCTSASSKSTVKHDIVAITPQSHANVHSNSASNHSTASNNTTATTHIDNVSNHSSHHSHHSHSPHRNVNSNKLPIAAVPVPELANPLPPAPIKHTQHSHSHVPHMTHGSVEGIVIPMDQQNYNALLQQMYPQQMVTNNGQFAYGSVGVEQRYNPYTRGNYGHGQDEMGAVYDASMAAPFNIYSTYDTNPYLYNTPPLPNNNGYYAHSKPNYYTPPSQPAPPAQPSNYGYSQPQPSVNSQYYYPPQQPTIGPVLTSPHAQSPHTPSQPTKPVISAPEDKVTYLQRCDGTIISPNTDPLSISRMSRPSKDEEADAFTAGDDALFGNNMVTIITVNWTTNIPFATIRMHMSNRIHHVPLMDLSHIKSTQNRKKDRAQSHNNRYRMGATNTLNTSVDAQKLDNITTTVIRRNPKLSDETLMKLPHLRKHRDYIRRIDMSMGPKDYNSFRVSVNSKSNNDDANTGNNGRTANIQNLNAKNISSNTGNLNAGLNLNKRNGRKNKRMSACEKGDLFKTELCENWVKKGHCTYGKKCHFAHGRDDIRTRWRIENYKTQPCCDPARADSRLCLFGKRCNYAHPGEPLRRSHHCLYLDEEYQQEILKDYGANTPYPFGIYI